MKPLGYFFCFCFIAVFLLFGPNHAFGTKESGTADYRVKRSVRGPGDTTFCGDGVRNGEENCDDGNQINPDADHPEDTCSWPCCFRADCPLCGNSIQEVLYGEECDDGNLADDDGCSSRCTFACQSCSKSETCEAPNRAYDQINKGSTKGAADECHDQNAALFIFEDREDFDYILDKIIPDDIGSGDRAWTELFFNCENNWVFYNPFTEPPSTIAYNGDIWADFNGNSAVCETPPLECNNGPVAEYDSRQCCAYIDINQGENLIAAACAGPPKCKAICFDKICKAPKCGNLKIDTGEECDDGNLINSDNCTNYCKLPACKDCILNDGENGCEDFNNIDTDGCTNSCKIARCGDSIIGSYGKPPDNTTEECDNGDGNNCDLCACTSKCKVNQPPVVSNYCSPNVTTKEDTSKTIDPISELGYYDPEEQTLKLSNVQGGDHGTCVLNADNTITYTPKDDYYGNDECTFTVSDGYQPNNQDAKLCIDIESVNDPPVAVDDGCGDNGRLQMNEDTVFVYNVVENDYDQGGPDGPKPISIKDVSGGDNGVCAKLNDTHIQYTPKKDYYGPDSCEYEITDGEDVDSASVCIMVNNVNDPPVAVDDGCGDDGPLQMNEDTVFIYNVVENDYDQGGPDGPDPILIKSVSGGNNGNCTIINDTHIQYTPDKDYYGPDNCEYEITDGEDDDSASVCIMVNNVNDNPVPPNVCPQPPLEIYETVEPENYPQFNVLANTTDIDNGQSDLFIESGSCICEKGGTCTVGPAPQYILTYQPPTIEDDITDNCTFVVKDGEDENSSGEGSFCVFVNNVFCGDGVVEPPEQCDFGPDQLGDGCNAECESSCIICWDKAPIIDKDEGGFCSDHPPNSAETQVEAEYECSQIYSLAGTEKVYHGLLKWYTREQFEKTILFLIDIDIGSGDQVWTEAYLKAGENGQNKWVWKDGTEYQEPGKGSLFEEFGLAGATQTCDTPADEYKDRICCAWIEVNGPDATHLIARACNQKCTGNDGGVVDTSNPCKAKVVCFTDKCEPPFDLVAPPK